MTRMNLNGTVARTATSAMPDPAAALAAHVRAAVSTYGHTRLELEWRLGHRQGQFRPGVGGEAWRRLQTALEASPAFTKSFTDTLEKMGDAAGVKCMHDFATDATSWMHKRRLADVDVDPSEGSARPWSMRASVSLEEVDATEPSRQQQHLLKYERRKKRWSYRHRCWSVDLTIVRSNLPAHLDEDEDAYEVEIELVDQGVLFEKTVEYVVAWGFRLADDMMALMSGGGQSSPAPRLLWSDM